jgi:hypothetical protein
MMDQRDVLALYEEYTQAIVDKDTETLDTILADDFTHTHVEEMAGYIQVRDAWLVKINEEHDKYDNTQEEFVQIFDGEPGTWHVTGDNIYNYQCNGENVQSVPTRTDLDVVEEDGELKILNAMEATY